MKYLSILLIFICSYSFSCNIIVTSKSIPANCNGGVGQILLTKVDGGKRPYTFKWSNDSTTQNLKARSGKYTVTVTDANGCSTSLTDSIVQPNKLVLTMIIDNILCKGTLAKVSTITSGGTSPYTYKYFNRYNTYIGDTLTRVKPGAYRVRVIDSKGCTMETVGFKYIYDTVTQPIILDSIIQPKNSKSNKGEIYIRVKGYTSPYTYSWSDNSNNSYLKNIKVGTYQVTVTDKNLCKTIKSITVTQRVVNESILDGLSTTPTLGQNYPNPFNNSTVIEYIIPKDSDSYIQLISVSNNKIIEKYDLDYDKSSIVIERDKLKSGSYYYRLIVNNTVISTKQLIIQ